MFQNDRQKFGNPFFLPPAIRALEGEGEEGRVYGAFEVPSLSEEGMQVDPDDIAESATFECVDMSWFHRNQRPEVEWLDVFRDAPLSILQLDSFPMPPLPPQSVPGDIVWFEFGYSPAGVGESNGRIYKNLFSEGTSVRINYYEPREPAQFPGNGPFGLKGWLDTSYVSHWGSVPRGPGPRLQKFLAEAHESAGVAVYDVGQGSCQALIDKKLHIPLIYVDFGGGVKGNSKTFPEALRGFCLTYEPPVVLTHWDYDHWSSALRFPRALNTEWFAPMPPGMPIQRAFAAELHIRHNLYLWPEGSVPLIRGKNVLLERCTGTGTNDSGIAATFYATKLRRRNCLIPGDADYRYIPSVIAKERFNSLCLTHHGGRLHSKYYPIPKRGATSANSSGPRNSYKHPLFNSLTKHFDSGWGAPAQTGFSGQRPCHVLLPWGKQSLLFQGGCHGGECSVAPTKMAPTSTNAIKWAIPLDEKSPKIIETDMMWLTHAIP